MKGSFTAFHPIVNFTYFIAVTVFSTFLMHPLFLGISLISAFIYSVQLLSLIHISSQQALGCACSFPDASKAGVVDAESGA